MVRVVNVMSISKVVMSDKDNGHNSSGNESIAGRENIELIENTTDTVNKIVNVNET